MLSIQRMNNYSYNTKNIQIQKNNHAQLAFRGCKEDLGKSATELVQNMLTCQSKQEYSTHAVNLGNLLQQGLSPEELNKILFNTVAQKVHGLSEMIGSVASSLIKTNNPESSRPLSLMSDRMRNAGFTIKSTGDQINNTIRAGNLPPSVEESLR